MRLGSAVIDGACELVVEIDGDIAAVKGFAGGMHELLAAGPEALHRLQPRPAVSRNGARLMAPLRPGKIIAIGLNYLDHIRETGMEPPVRPLIFTKFPSSVVGPDAPILIPAEITQRVDWEVELAVVMGARVRHVTAEHALEHVFGYTVANDVSARDVQFGDGQWVRGKSLDTFCPLGPMIVTADEITDPQRLPLRTRVNGETVQDSTTSEMIFGVAALIEFCSANFTLEPGDVILTGTPWGCGEFMSPARSLAAGDIVEAEIDGIGRLRNPVQAAPDSSRASR